MLKTKIVNKAKRAKIIIKKLFKPTLEVELRQGQLYKIRTLV